MKTLEKEQPNRKIILAALALVIVFFWFRGGQLEVRRSTLAQGRQTYFVSSNQPGPKITEVTVDPFDPGVGDRQSISVAISDTQPVRRAMVGVHSDHGITEYPLSLTRGSATDGRWEAAWIVEDTHDSVYGADITAEGASGRALVELTFR